MAAQGPDERLQVILARRGVASRRGVISIIESGRIRVNGRVVREKGHRVRPEDRILLDGRPVGAEAHETKITYLFYKPKGVVTTLKDPHARKTVADFFKDISARLYPVGRLDRDTTGLLLMTNDGDLAFRLTHPRFGVRKKYRAIVKGEVSPKQARFLEGGIFLDDGRTAPCRVRIEKKSTRGSVLTLMLREGRKRQVRRMCEKIGHDVLELERYAYGPLTLGKMKPGDRRLLSAAEVGELRKSAARGIIVP